MNRFLLADTNLKHEKAWFKFPEEVQITTSPEFVGKAIIGLWK
jgi:hypothetical protein